MNSDGPEPDQNDQRHKGTARHALLRHRALVRQWGLFIAVALIILGIVVAPRLTLLVCLALAFFAVAGLLTGWGARLIGRLFDGR
jgi:uncharacterized membrane protein